MNIKDQKQKNLNYRNYRKYVGLALMASAAMIVLVEPAFASSSSSSVATGKFDIDAGVAAATTPFINGLKAHWGKGVLITAGGAAILGEGDGKQRAMRAGGAAGAAGAVILGLIALLS